MTAMSISDAATRIEETLTAVFASAARIGDHARTIWESAVDAPSVRDLEVLQPTIFAELDANAHYVGGGFLVEPGALSDANRYLEWWQKDASGSHSRLVLDLDPRRPDGYDYVTMDWYVGAKAGTPTVRGPYLDYAGADGFIFTFASPVTAGGRFIGTGGADVLVTALDPLLFDQIRTGPESLALVDRDGRVIVSNSPDSAPSERLRPRSVENAIAIGGEGVGWRLCTLTSR